MPNCSNSLILELTFLNPIDFLIIVAAAFLPLGTFILNLFATSPNVKSSNNLSFKIISSSKFPFEIHKVSKIDSYFFLFISFHL